VSLRFRLFLSHAIVIVVGLTVLFVALLILLRQTETRRLQRQLGNTAAAVARFGRLLPANDPPQRFVDRLTRFGQEQRARVLLLDARGEVLVDSVQNAPTSMVGQFIALEDTVPTGNAVPENSAVGEFRDPQGRRFTYAAVPTPNNARADIDWFVLAQPAGGPFMGVLDEVSMPMLQALVIALTISAVAAALVARSIARPIQTVAAGAQAIAQGNYSQRVAVSGPAEVKQLAHDFNDMAAQVQAARQTERDFVANVSHELKTPLTSIQGFAQAIRDGDVRDAEGTHHAASIIFDEAERLTRLVSGLLESARMESGNVRMARETVHLNELTQACVMKMQPRAQAAEIALEAQLAPAMPAITADGDRLAQVITNLIDNAIKHTPKGSKVTVETRLARNFAEVSVADNGVGIPPEDLPHVFDRFYQADKSRSAGGSGLGLAICKQIVEAHGGQINAQSVLGLGTRISVWLPLSSDGATSELGSLPNERTSG
jgi:signal transduction histidine kinase